MTYVSAGYNSHSFMATNVSVKLCIQFFPYFLPSTLPRLSAPFFSNSF